MLSGSSPRYLSLNPEMKEEMFTRASSLLIRAAAVVGTGACAAAFAGVAHAGTPADALTATVATATQPAAATVTPAARPDASATAEAVVGTVSSTVSTTVTQAKDVVPQAAAPVAAEVSRAPAQALAATGDAAANVLSSAVRASSSAVETAASVASPLSGPTTESAAVLPAPDQTPAAPVRTHSDGETGGTSAAAAAAPEVVAPSATPVEGARPPGIAPRPARARHTARARSAAPVLLTMTDAATVSAPDPKSEAGGSRAPAPRRDPPGGALVDAVGGQGSGGGLLLFGLAGLLFLLVIPNAVRWLRPALALGLSPAYVATRDRPG